MKHKSNLQPENDPQPKTEPLPNLHLAVETTH